MREVEFGNCGVSGVKVGKYHLCCDKNDVHILLNCSETERWRQLNQKWPSNNDKEAYNKFVKMF
jgi:hypothetical protein